MFECGTKGPTENNILTELYLNKKGTLAYGE